MCCMRIVKQHTPGAVGSWGSGWPDTPDRASIIPNPAILSKRLGDASSMHPRLQTGSDLKDLKDLKDVCTSDSPTIL